MRGDNQPLIRFRVLLTRQSEFKDDLVAKLEVLGASTAAVPVLAVCPTGGPQCRAGMSIRDRPYTDVIFVSRNAVVHGLARAKELPGFDQARVLAVGKATARALEARGITALSPEQGSGSEALIALPPLSDWSGRTVLIVRGTQGREWLKEEIERRGSSVEYMAAYCVSTPVEGADMLARTAREFNPNVIFIHSRAALENMLKISAEAAVSLAGTPLVVGAEPVRDAALAAGWSSTGVHVAGSPGDNDMLAALCSIA